MRLLILTQVLDKDDSVLGYFHRFVEEFAKTREKVTVICLEEGEYDLPRNVRVLSLGKKQFQISDFRFQIFKRLSYIWNFYTYIWRERKRYDTVFVHMNPEYVVLGGIPWRLWKKKIGLWYVHRNVDLKLRIAEKLAHFVFSSSKEGFQIRSEKVHFLGHGIDTEYFSRCPKKREWDERPFRVAHVGRITPIKNLTTFLKALSVLKERGISATFFIVGMTATDEDKVYMSTLKDIIAEHDLEGSVVFYGAVAHNKMRDIYADMHLTVNLTPRGGMDKAVLESLASGTPVVTSNDAFRDLFGEYKDAYIFKERDKKDLADKIEKLYSSPAGNVARMASTLQRTVKKRFGVAKTCSRITELLERS